MRVVCNSHKKANELISNNVELLTVKSCCWLKTAPELQYFAHEGRWREAVFPKLPVIYTDTPLHKYYTKYCGTLYKILLETTKGNLWHRLYVFRAELLSCQTYLNCFTKFNVGWLWPEYPETQIRINPIGLFSNPSVHSSILHDGKHT